ncbi:uncharacterized protein LOC120699159 [Panicum virgatum]|uniref:uncharacterized protein LOC120699159 n=1 Tax=Panicum virgatum TaxID=38727 RepID=UPI0019D504BF|nr:uncharacterized protein LOC120699159 [Panicum virgatum]
MHIFGEAAIMIAIDPKTLGITDFFRCFYNGFPEISTIWFAYQDEKVIYENPFKFQLDSWKTDEDATKIMKEITSPRILPINFTAGKDIPSYEFYNPSVAARQLGLRQVPPLPFFVGKVQFRGALDSALSYDRLKNLEPEIDMKALADWQTVPFITTSFTQWWSEWQEHIFCKAANLYCITLNENYQAADNEGDGTDPPTISRSGQSINYALPADKPNIGHDAPTLTDVATRKKRKLSYTKVTTRKKKKSPGQSSAISASQIDNLANPPSPPSEDIPEDQSGGEEDSQSPHPCTPSTIQVFNKQPKLLHNPESCHHFFIDSFK